MPCLQPLSEPEMERLLQENLVGITSASISGSESRAAVLMPMFCQDGEWRLLFIRRAEYRGDKHSGQVAFPGGRWEAGDEDLCFTALRESREEIGLDPGDVRIIGRLDRLNTSTGFLVSPYVGIIPWPRQLRIDTNEVSRVFSIPLSWLADAAHWEEREYTPPAGPVRRHPVIFYLPYDGEILWGASARMVIDLLERLKLLRPS